MCRTAAVVIVLLTFNTIPAVAMGLPSSDAQSEQVIDEPPSPEWQYGGFVDGGYLFDVNDSTKKPFRSRGTTWHLNEFDVNMVGGYIRRRPSSASRLGGELALHAGKDDAIFGFSATAPNLAGHEWLRHVGLANITYLAPFDRGLVVQAGIFASLIGYDSLYAKDNFSYTRPWGADFTPYLMMGVNASYPLTEKLNATGYVVNGYWHLANANHVPSSGAQLSYKATSHLTVKETVLWGPHQSNTSMAFWRFLTDTIIEHRTDGFVMAFNSHFATETVDEPGRLRAWWVAAQLPMRWTPGPTWSVSIRPEVAWDSASRWTLAEQTVKAITTTAEYRLAHKWLNTMVRAEYRLDNSTGPGGGFFDGDATGAEPANLKRRQQLLIVGVILTFDSQ